MANTMFEAGQCFGKDAKITLPLMPELCHPVFRFSLTPDEVTVNKGDSLWSIAKSALQKREIEEPSGSEIRRMIKEIADINDISNPNKIRANSKLLMPTEEPASELSWGPYYFPKFVPMESLIVFLDDKSAASKDDSWHSDEGIRWLSPAFTF